MKPNYLKKMNDTLRLGVAPAVLGFSLVFSGLGIIFIPDANMLATVISSFMFLSGLAGVIYILTYKDQFDGWSFYLTVSILDFILGTLLITTPEIKMTTISMMISLWLLFQGLGKIIYSLDIQKLGVRNWDSDLATGVLSVVYGVSSIFLLSSSSAFILLISAFVLNFIGLFQISLSFKRQGKYDNNHNVIKVKPAKVSIK